MIRLWNKPWSAKFYRERKSYFSQSNMKNQIRGIIEKIPGLVLFFTQNHMGFCVLEYIKFDKGKRVI